jgi:PAS domain S-box-containing protein
VPEQPTTGETSPTLTELEASGRGLVEQRVFETAVRKTRMAMALADPNLPDCPLVYVNRAFTEMTGYPTDKLIGHNCRFLQGVDTDRETVARIRRAIANREPITEEIYNYRQDGSGFWNELYISPVFADDGTLSYFFASQIDISIRKEAERRHRQRNESMGALVSGIAHEVNNQMTVVLGNIERAGVDLANEAHRRHLMHAGLAARRTSEIAGHLLSLTGRTTGEEQPVDLNSVLLDCAAALNSLAPPSVQIRVDLASTPLFVRLDKLRLEPALAHLVRNAVEAMLQGGEVNLGISGLAPSAAGFDGSEAVALTVSDNGQGMPPKVLERATEVFFTTKPAASGLGLFLVLDFVERSNGRLAIDSRVGEGTKVSLVFPRSGER